MAGRVGFVLDALSWAGASVLFAIGLAAVVGWVSGRDELVRLHESFAPVQWTTALSLIGAALALMLAAQHYRRAARATAAIPLVLGAVALAEAAFNLPPVVGRLLARAVGVSRWDLVGSMAPVVAIGIGAIAIGATMLTSRAWRSFAIGLTIPAIVMALPALVGYAVGRPTFDTGAGIFPVQTAIALLAAALALGALALAPDEHESPRWFWMPVAVAVLMVAPIALTGVQEASVWGIGATLTESTLTLGILTAAALGLVLARGARRALPERPLMLRSLRGLMAAPRKNRRRPPIEPADDLFRALIQVAPIGIYVTDARGQCLFVNEHWCALAGLSYDEAGGPGWRGTVHEDDRARVLRRWDAQASGGDPFDEDYRFARPDGQLTWVEDRAMPLRHGDGRLAGYVGAVMDVGGRREAENAAARREEAWRLIIDAQQGGVFEWDIEHDEMWWSPRVHELLGVDRDAQPTPTTFHSLAAPDDRARLQLSIKAHFESGAPLRLVVRLRFRGGVYRSYLLSGKAARDGEGRPLRLNGSIVELPRDI